MFVIAVVFLSGNGQYGGRSTLTLAEDYVFCASHHRYNYETPKILFVFSNGVTTPMKTALQHLGVEVHGEETEVTPETNEKLRLPGEFGEPDDSTDDEDMGKLTL